MNNSKVQLRVQGPVAGRGLLAAALAGLLLAGLALAGCGGKKASARGPQAMPVQVMPAQPSTVSSSSSFVATLQSRRAATIMPQVTGNLTRILVRSGQHVRAGQLLM
ncbi:MAG: biotin/lipoyl-binding protein, partial [Terriglobales bacterium]